MERPGEFVRAGCHRVVQQPQSGCRGLVALGSLVLLAGMGSEKQPVESTGVLHKRALFQDRPSS